jgi:Tfp pilus assembly protein PilX
MEQLRTRQQGVVLFIALIVLVALTLAGIALVRSVDTSNVIAGNLAFKAGTLQAADIGIEQAASVLPTIVTTTLETNQTPASSSTNPNYWYYATRRQDDAKGLPTTKEYGAAGTASAIDWSSVPPVSSTAVAGNTVQVVIDRLCQGPPPVTDIQGKCFADDPVGGGTKKAGGIVFSANDTVYYRATVRVSGPRNTVSVVQAILSK